MAYYQRLLNEVIAHCPGIQNDVFSLALWNALDEACREGWIIVETVEVTLTEDDLTYNLVSGFTGFKVFHVLRVTHDKFTEDDYYILGDELIFEELPTAEQAADPMYVTVALTITDDATLSTVLADDMWTRIYKLLLHNTLANIMAQPAKPYTNISLATYHRRCFNSLLAQERHYVRTAGSPDKQLWTFPRHTR